MTGPHRWPARFIVPLPKITRYLLDLASPDGAAKARYLISYGFDLAEPRELERALLDHARRELFSQAIATPAGFKYVFEGDVPAPNGKTARMRTVWQLESGATEARLITAVPSGR